MNDSLLDRSWRPDLDEKETGNQLGRVFSGVNMAT